MSEERVTALTMISIAKDFIMEISDFSQCVLGKIAAMKERKMDFIFKCE